MNVLRTILDSGLTVAVASGAWLIGVTAALARVRAANRPQPVEQRAQVPSRRPR
jgi:hypothetical protein